MPDAPQDPPWTKDPIGIRIGYPQRNEEPIRLDFKRSQYTNPGYERVMFQSEIQRLSGQFWMGDDRGEFLLVGMTHRSWSSPLQAHAALGRLALLAD